MATISINKINVSGGNINISNGKILIDGKDVTPDAKDITITVEGNIQHLSADTCNKISVTGDVDSIKTMSGNVFISGYVEGSIQTMSGHIECGNVAGNASSMSGDITYHA